MPQQTKSILPIHAGETLREDFLEPLGLSANRVAIELRVPVTRVNDIVRGQARYHCRYRFGETAGVCDQWGFFATSDARKTQIAGRVAALARQLRYPHSSAASVFI